MKREGTARSARISWRFRVVTNPNTFYSPCCNDERSLASMRKTFRPLARLVLVSGWSMAWEREKADRGLVGAVVEPAFVPVAVLAGVLDDVRVVVARVAAVRVVAVRVAVVRVVVAHVAVARAVPAVVAVGFVGVVGFVEFVAFGLVAFVAIAVIVAIVAVVAIVAIVGWVAFAGVSVIRCLASHYQVREYRQSPNQYHRLVLTNFFFFLKFFLNYRIVLRT